MMLKYLLCFLLVLLGLGSCVATPSEGDLIIFVGKKIEVSEVSHRQPGSLDNEFRAKYEILDLVYGNYKAPMIEFAAYDHYGYPQFANYDMVMLYVSKVNFFRLVHEKYQFHDVYRTSDGRWAGCGDPYRRESKDYRGRFTAQKIKYEPLDVSQLEAEEIEQLYPPALFEYRNNTVVCKEGAFIDVLFQVKRQGVLKARDIFD